MNVTQLTNSAIINTVRKAANKESTKEINKMFSLRNNETTRMDNVFKIETELTNKRRGKNILDIGKQTYNSQPPLLRSPFISKFSYKKQLKLWIKTTNKLIEH